MVNKSENQQRNSLVSNLALNKFLKTMENEEEKYIKVSYEIDNLNSLIPAG